MGSQDHRRFLRRAALFLAGPFLLIGSLWTLEMFVLPIDRFYSRVWEGEPVVVRYLKDLLPGPYYPFAEVHRRDLGGDLGNGTPYALLKTTDSHYDEFGQRNRPGHRALSEVVVVGDSFVTAGEPSQDDMLVGVLERLIQRGVYSYYGSLNGFLADPWFQDHPPKVVVYCCTERFLSLLEDPKEPAPGQGAKGWAAWRQKRWFQVLAVLLDRTLKAPLIHSLQRKVHSRQRGRNLSFQVGGPFLFRNGDKLPRDASDEFLQGIAGRLAGYQELLRRRGTRTIFMPVPEKESVYPWFLNDKRPHVLLGKLLRSTKERGIDSVELQPIFEGLAGRYGQLLYHRDDTHWNKAGIRVAAIEVREHLRSLQPDWFPKTRP